MAAGTVGYTDTRGSKDYLGIIAGQIGRRLKEASNMAAEERAYASKKAEAGGTSLEEAGIGKGYFFRRALGSRFGGDRIARTRGRLGAQGPGTDPTRNFKQRFRGGFDYNVTNQINQVTKEVSSAVVPMSGALVTGLRGVESGLDNVGRAIDNLGQSVGQLARSQQDMAKEVMMMGAFMRAFMSYVQRQQSRSRSSAEEASIEGRRRLLSAGSGGGVNVSGLLPGGGGSRGGGFSGLNALDTAQTLLKASTNTKGIQQAANVGGAIVKAGSKGSSIIRSGTSNAVEMAGKASRSVGSGIAKRFSIEALKRTLETGGLRSVLRARAAMDAAAVTGPVNAIRKTPKGAINPTSKKITSTLDNILGKPLSARQSDEIVELAADLVKKGMPENKAMTIAIQRVMPDAAARFKKVGQQAATTTALVMNAGETVPEALAKNDGAIKAGLSAVDGPLAKMFGKHMGKSFMKKIPALAAVAGFAFGIERAMRGDTFGAALEIVSGVLGAFPPTAGLSLGLDGFILARDLAKMGAMPSGRDGMVTSGPKSGYLAQLHGTEVTLSGERSKEMEAISKNIGQGVFDVQKANKKEFAKMHADGLSEYYDRRGGWETFATILEGPKKWLESLKSVFTVPPSDPDGLTPPEVAPFSTEGYEVGKSKLAQDIMAFRKARMAKFNVSDKRIASNTTGFLQIRDLRMPGKTGQDTTINPLADDLSYQPNDHKGAAHKHGYGFDVPIRDTQQAKFVIEFFRSRGYETIYGDAGHQNHVHVQAPHAEAEKFLKKIEEPTPEMTPEQKTSMTTVGDNLKTASLLNQKSLETSPMIAQFATPIINNITNNYTGSSPQATGDVAVADASFSESGLDFARFKFAATL